MEGGCRTCLPRSSAIRASSHSRLPGRGAAIRPRSSARPASSPTLRLAQVALPPGYPGRTCLIDLFGSTVRLFSATFRVPIAVTGNRIRETKQQQASTTPAEQTTPAGGF